MNTDEVSHTIAEANHNIGEPDFGNGKNSSTHGDRNGNAVRLLRPVRVSTITGDATDTRVVSYHLYNSFNFSMLIAKDQNPLKLSLGVTSPNQGEGKTTAVCNLAAALSIGSGRKTVIVDFNLMNPKIHEVFGTPRGPGLTEALIGDDICVVPTELENLYALPAGNTRLVSPNRLPVFRDILESLFKEFEIVIMDLPPVEAHGFPTLIANQLNGLLVVIRPGMTKRREVNRLFRKVREESVIGFIMNAVDDNDI